MERRTKLLILIIIAFLILAFGIWFLLQPSFKTVQQPPDVTGSNPTTNFPSTNTSTRPTGTGSTAAVPQDIKQLQDLSEIFVERIGSGSSGSGFLGYDDVLINATITYREALRSEQAALQAAHPSFGESFGIVTRAVSVKSVSAESGAAQMTFAVQAQQVEDTGNPDAPTNTKYKEATVTFERQSDGTYLVSNVVWQDIVR